MRGVFLVLQALVALVCFIALPARATTYTNTSPGYWTNNASWTGTPLSSGTNDDTGVILLRAIGATSTVLTNNFDTVVLNRLALDTNRNTVLQGPGVLVFTNAGAALQNNSANSLTVNEAIRITGSTLFRTFTNGNTIINSNITGSGSIVVSNTGIGMIRLSGSNSFSGGLTLAAGQLDLRNASALGTGAFTIGPSGAGSMSTQFLDSTIATTITTTNNQFWNSSFTFLGSANLALGPGSVTLGTNLTLTVSASTLTVPASITGAYSLVKAGAGTLALTGSNSLSGGLSISAGGVTIGNNGVVNVGGISQAAAMASTLTMTNAGGTLTLGNAGGSGTLNASTNGPGLLNQGTFTVQNSSGRTGFVSAVVLNDAGGTLTSPNNGTLVLWAMPTNRGTLNVSGTTSLTVNNGDLVNQSNTVMSGSGPTLTIPNGIFINDTGGALMYNSSAGVTLPSILNRGVVFLTNTSGSAGLRLGAGGITNQGTFSFAFSPVTTANATKFWIAAAGTAIVVNVSGGNMVATSYDGGLTGGANLIRFDPTTPVTNQAGAMFTVTNQAVVGFVVGSDLGNRGTLAIYSNSALGIGYSGNNLSNTVITGKASYQNEGAISLRGGAFGATVLSNASTAALDGYGDVGQVRYTNAVSADNTLTNLVRHVEVSRLVNLGAITPSGTLNLGTVSNMSGASIIGYGRVASHNITNYFSGGTLVSTNLNTGGSVANLSGGTVLADGATLALQNGFSGNTQAGTIGTTNGGILLLGDGTLALTNSGTVRLQGGALQVGALVNSGSLVGTGAVQAATVTSSGTLAPGFSPGTLGFSNDLTLTGSSVLNLEIAGTNSTDYDRLLVGGAFTQDGTLNISFLSYTPTGGEVFDLFDFASLVGSFSTTNLPTLGGGLAWDFTNFDTQGTLGITMPIPEPGATTLLCLAAAGLLFLRRRRE